MNSSTLNKVKRGICKIQGVCRSHCWEQPYLLENEYEAGGTGFMVDPSLFGEKFTPEAGARYLLTNFHVVQNYSTRWCLLEWPERKNSFLSCKVKHVSPNLDVAILELNPALPQPRWWEGDAVEWIASIPNCPLNTTEIIKGASQKIKSVGFPNLQSDYQISDGSLSSRGLGMLQLDLSLNGGNSGGPLFLKNKVVGICTAAVSDSERLGLAVPIQEIFRFFTHWCEYEDVILRLPCWGLRTQMLTEDYMAYKKIPHRGVLVKTVLSEQACDTAGLKPNDILLSITSGGKTYDVDTHGLVQVDYTDKRVELTSVEFVLNLTPDDIKVSYYRKKVHTTKVHLEPIEFKVRLRYPQYEAIEHCVFAGMTYTNLNLNNLEDSDDEEDDEPVMFDHSILNTLQETSGMENITICTHINAQSYVTYASNMAENERLIKVNGTKVKDVKHLNTILDNVAKRYYAFKSDYVIFETNKGRNILSLDRLSEQERQDNQKYNYVGVLRLLRRRRKRKR